jgi:hypothetical protein
MHLAPRARVSPPQLEGENGLLAYLGRVIAAKGHCVVCVAEGAGQVRRAPRAAPA